MVVAQVAGWGAVDERASRTSDTLLYVKVPFADKETCKTVYSTTRTELGPGQGSRVNSD